MPENEYILKGYFDFDPLVQVTLPLRLSRYTELLEAVQGAISDRFLTDHQGRVAVGLYYVKHTQGIRGIHDDRDLWNAIRDFKTSKWIQNATYLCNTAKKRSVWVMGNPLSLLHPIEGIKRISEGHFSLNHWSVLITERGDNEKEPIFRIRAKLSGMSKRFELASFYELRRNKKYPNTLNHNSTIRICDLAEKCPMAAFRYAGCTTKSEDEILGIGSFIRNEILTF